MTDQHSGAEHTFFVQLVRPRQAHHLPDGGPGLFRIIRSPGIPCRRRRKSVFQVGHKNRNALRQSANSLRSFVARGVPYDRYARSGDPERFQDLRSELCARDQIQVMDPHRLQLSEDPGEPFDRDGLPCPAPAELVVLAVNTAQRTAREEHRSASPLPADTGLLSVMRCRPGHDDLRADAAHAPHAFPVRAAAAGAEPAFTHATPRRSTGRLPSVRSWAGSVRIPYP